MGVPLYASLYTDRLIPYQALANSPVPGGDWSPENEFSARVAQYGAYASLYEDMKRALDNEGTFSFNCGVTKDELTELQDEVHAIRQRLERMARDNALLPQSPIRLSIDLQRLTAARMRLSAAAGVDPQKLSGDDAARWLAANDSTDAALLRLANDLQLPLKDRKWVRTRMPYPAKSDETQSWSDDRLRDKLAALYFEGPAKRRCRAGATARGCLSNREIELWRSRIELGKGISRGDQVGDKSPEWTPFDDAVEPRIRSAQLRRIDIHVAHIGHLAGLQFSFADAKG